MTRPNLKAILWCAFLLSLVCSADNSPAQTFKLYVGNSRGDDISVVDMASLKVTGTIQAGERVHGVCAQADGKRLFATVESDHTLRIFDTGNQQTVATIKLPGRPNQCAATPDGKYVAVPIRDGDSVAIVDVDHQKIVKSLPIKEPHNALNTGSNRYIYVSSMGSHEIDVIDLETMDFSAHIPAGGRPRPYVVSPDGSTMYVAVADLHGFVIVEDRKIGLVQIADELAMAIGSDKKDVHLIHPFLDGEDRLVCVAGAVCDGNRSGVGGNSRERRTDLRGLLSPQR